MAKILIVGGGVAGLSAGIYAQKSGHQAVICEQQATTGGNLTGWQRGEYHIDNCIHWLTGTNPASDTYKIWTDLGALGNVDVYQADTLYTYEENGERLSLNKDLDALEEDMLTLSPADKKEILAFTKAVRSMQGMSGFGGKTHDKKSPLVSGLFFLPALHKYYKLSTGELAARFRHPLIRHFLTSILSEHFSSLALIIVFSTFCGENGGIPKGSSRAMAERMTKKFLDLGGELHLKKQAVKIRTKDGKATAVEFSDGTSMDADYVILTTDPKVTFGKLLDAPMPKALQKQYANPDMMRFSSYHCAFACDTRKLPFESDFIFRIPTKYRSALHTDNLIIREFSHEKSFAPKGKTVLQSITFCDERTAKKFIKLRNDKAAYQKKKKEIANVVLELIIQKFPKLDGKLTCIDVWTPATYERYTHSEIGSFMSFVLPSGVIPRKVDNRVKEAKNVFLATQWQQAPGGLPIAAKLGKEAIDAILKKERGGKRTRAQK